MKDEYEALQQQQSNANVSHAEKNIRKF
jgi:hypothetical protein